MAETQSEASVLPVLLREQVSNFFGLTVLSQGFQDYPQSA